MLKKFKELSYPKGLLEHFKNATEFRDKFNKQLELTVRDLQSTDALGTAPLSLEFLSIESGGPVGSTLAVSCDCPDVDLSELQDLPQEKVDEIAEAVRTTLRANAYIPLALAIRNSSSSGVRNLYVQIDFSSAAESLELTSTIPRPASRYSFTITTIGHHALAWDEPPAPVAQALSKFSEDTLQKTESGWTLSFEWDALQPQRVRLIRPILYVFSPQTTSLSIKTKIFADSFPQPLVLEANMAISTTRRAGSLTALLPDWKKLIE